jgi:hypothetical protein
MRFQLGMDLLLQGARRIGDGDDAGGATHLQGQNTARPLSHCARLLESQ